MATSGRDVIVIATLTNISGKPVAMRPLIALIFCYTALPAQTPPVPPEARRAFEHGANAAGKKKNAEAIANFDQALKLYLAYTDAWCGKGSAQ